MNHDLMLQLVVTRAGILDADFDEALNKLREIKAFADARGLVQGFVISINNSAEAKKGSN